MLAAANVTVIPRDEQAIKEAREKYGWRVSPHTKDGGPRPKWMSLDEDNLDYGISRQRQ
jgi:hypothetical protein